MTDPCPGCDALREQLAEARAEVERLREKRRRPPGPKPQHDRSARGRLIEAACKAKGLTHKDLADHFKIDRSRFSPSGVFPKRCEAEIVAKLREMAGWPPSAEKKSRQKPQ